MRASARLGVRPISQADLAVYQRVLPEKSLLLDALEVIPWERLQTQLRKYYSKSNEGQPEYPPLILLKLELLCHLYGMGREKAIERATCDLHWKFFLGLPIASRLPDQSTLCVFRKRLGVEGFREIFDDLVRVAREEGLISDCLRLKDATHLYADVAVPTALELFAQLRDRMLKAIERWDSAAADSFRFDLDSMRRETCEQSSELRLAARVGMVRDLLAWIRQQDPPVEAAPLKRWQSMQATGDLAEKILFDLDHPGNGDKTRSVTDPDARRGKHGQYYDGYLLEVMMDAQSELVTAIDVLPANADEARNIVNLVEMEQAAHGNDIESLSIDGVGFNGEVLQQLTDPQGLNLEVFTPPRNFRSSAGFASDQFQLVEEGTRVLCPAGVLSGLRSIDKRNPHKSSFDFLKSVCAACLLRSACHPNAKAKNGRRVYKNAYDHQYERAWEISRTPRYAEVRRQHPAIERKLNEFVRHHGTRRTRHRGRWRVQIQQLLTGVAINLKRMVKLLQGQYAPALSAGLQ